MNKHTPPEKRGPDSPYWQKRIKLVLDDPNNAFIPRVADAGCIRDGCQIMHNGLKVVEDGYYGKPMTVMMECNRGVHEPQEERAFAEILHWVPRGGSIMELGAYWAFYSMWFHSAVKNAGCFLVDRDRPVGPATKTAGCRNFELNGFDYTHAYGTIGEGTSVDGLMDQFGLPHLAILHSDIQGAEVPMLRGAVRALYQRAIDYLVISTHGNARHKACTLELKHSGYIKLVNISPAQSYCTDGILIYRSPDTIGPVTIDVIPRPPAKAS